MANIQKRGDTYRIRVSCGVDASGKQIFRSKTWKPTPGMTDRQREKEAARQAILFEEECKAGAYTLSGSVKFQTFAEQWFREAASKTNKPLSLKRLHSYEKRTYAALGHLRMDKISTRAVQAFIDNLSEEGISERTTHAIPKDLGAVLAARGLSQKALAKQAGLGGSTVSSACRGKCVTMATAGKIAAALQVDLETLFTPKDERSCLSPKTIKNYLSFVSDVMRYAIRSGMIQYNPCQNVILPTAQRKEKEVYTPEEAQAFLESLGQEPLKYQAFCILAIYGGFRRGELLGLEWHDLDFEHCVVSIRRTSQYTKEKGYYAAPTKTEQSNRDIKLPSEVFSLLRRFRAEQGEERLRLGDQWHDSDRLFVTWNGKPMAPNTPYTWLRRFCERTGQRFLGVHQFRHLNASLLINSGIDVTTVSRSLGHSQTTTTLNIYAHTFRAAQAKASEAIANALPLKSAHDPAAMTKV